MSRLISCAGCACSLTGVPAAFAQLPAVQRQFWQPEKRRSFRARREGVGACLCCRYTSGSGLLNRKTLQMSRVSPVCVCVSEREPEHAGCFVSRCHLSSWAHFKNGITDMQLRKLANNAIWGLLGFFSGGCLENLADGPQRRVKKNRLVMCTDCGRTLAASQSGRADR